MREITVSRQRESGVASLARRVRRLEAPVNDSAALHDCYGEVKME